MKITFSDLKFRSQEDYEILNIGSIKEITCDDTTKMCTITFENEVCKIPYFEHHVYERIILIHIVCMKPHATTLDEYLEIGISYTGKVTMFDYSAKYIDESFKKRCRPFLGMKQ